MNFNNNNECSVVLSSFAQACFDFVEGPSSFSPSTNGEVEANAPSPSAPPILLVGDYMVDEWHVVEADGTSAEATIPRYREVEKVECPGGAGNVRRNLELLGATVVGPKPKWDEMVPTKVRYITREGLQVLRVDRRDYNSPCEYVGMIPKIKVIVVSDYCKGTITQHLIDQVHTLRESHNAVLIVDTKGVPNVWRGPKTIFVPNVLEYYKYKDFFDAQYCVLLKRGKFGAEFRSKGITQCSASTTNTHPRSVCGAGDVVLAAFANAYNTSTVGDIIRLEPIMDIVGRAMESRFTCTVKS